MLCMSAEAGCSTDAHCKKPYIGRKFNAGGQKAIKNGATTVTNEKHFQVLIFQGAVGVGHKGL